MRHSPRCPHPRAQVSRKCVRACARRGSGRRDLAVGSRRCESGGGERRIVAGMNDVVHESGWSGCFAHSGVSTAMALCSWARLVSVGDSAPTARARRRPPHRCPPDVLRRAFPWRPSTHRCGPENLRHPAGRNRRARRCIPARARSWEGVPRLPAVRASLSPWRCRPAGPRSDGDAHGNSPARHRAPGVAFEDSFELGFCLFVPKIMQQRDAAIELAWTDAEQRRERHPAQAILRQGPFKVGTRNRKREGECRSQYRCR